MRQVVCRRFGKNFVSKDKMGAEHIEDLQKRYAELKSRIALVRSYL
jgi:hypothetical protein